MLACSAWNLLHYRHLELSTSIDPHSDYSAHWDHQISNTEVSEGKNYRVAQDDDFEGGDHQGVASSLAPQFDNNSLVAIM
jgi:hypothetical protein